MHFAGIDIGSTCAKALVLGREGEVCSTKVMPTGWNAQEAAGQLLQYLQQQGYTPGAWRVVATGYGRGAVGYAEKTVTEITCHAKGAAHLFGAGTYTVVDIGGQDTKMIALKEGTVQDFVMNDKCAAGTGRFLEVMATTLGTDSMALCALAKQGGQVSITSMCTVFAESEVIGLIGAGASKADIARGIIDSITGRVKAQCGRIGAVGDTVYLTGGLCENHDFISALASRMEKKVCSHPLGRFAGALGAALMAQGLPR